MGHWHLRSYIGSLPTSHAQSRPSLFGQMLLNTRLHRIPHPKSGAPQGVERYGDVAIQWRTCFRVTYAAMKEARRAQKPKVSAIRPLCAPPPYSDADRLRRRD
jgi:hypothetical protein